MILSIPFPNIDPVAIELGPIAIRWYALAYVASLVLGWRHMRSLAAKRDSTVALRDVDDFVVWATLGVVLGGRLGYVLFYRPGHYLANPEDILAVWRGGMSFHGGLVGTAVAILLFARARRIPVLKLSDLTACAVPIGLFLGRVANFVNGELFGRPADVPWAIIFPQGGAEPRHPSQLYEAGLEGLALFAVLFVLERRSRGAARPGFLTGAFLFGYGVFRLIGELFREPDAHLGFLAAGATMGQLLSIPLILAGVLLVILRRP